MKGFTMTEWLAQSPAEVFAFINDTQNAPKVMKGVTHMEKITPGSLAVGTRFRETRVVNGKESQAELEVTAYEPSKRYSVTAVQEGITVTYHYTFAAENSGTRVNLSCEVKANGLKKLMLPLVTSIMKREDGDHLQRLKTAMVA